MLEVIMSDYHIRQYIDFDYEAVRKIFVDGQLEHIPNGTFSVLKNPRMHFLIFFVFLTVLICSKSFLFSFLAIALLLAAAWHFIHAVFHDYVDHSLRDDLLNIQKSYMENEDSCFWVAESNDVVIGMVGAQLHRNHDGEPKIQLKHMCVKKCYRKGGVAKALCRTVLSFARQRGYNAVILETTQIQYAAQRLYENLGFKKLYELPLPSCFGKLLHVCVFYYRYDIKPEVKTQELIMSDYHIRRYKDSDYEAVRTIFVDGLIEHIPNGTFSVLKNPRMHFLIFFVFLTMLICSKSFLFSVLAIAVLFAAVWRFIHIEFYNYIDHSLRDDLLDIQKSYMENDDSCFWVAESNGVVVGMVGANLHRNHDEEPKIELKRMSVKTCFRRGGVAKALCKTVLSFARQRGYNAVILQTTQIQYAAQKLYESLGFKKLYELPLPSYFGKLLHICVFCYRYDIKPEVK